MNKALLCLVLGTCAIVGGLHAQAVDGAWYAAVGGGLVAFDNGAFSHRLQSYVPSRPNGESITYSTPDFPTNGVTIDGSLAILLNDRLIVGAAGQMLTFGVIRAITSPGFPRDEYGLSGGGAGLDIGWAAVNDGGTLVAPFVQIGYYGYSLEYSNLQTDSIPFFEGKKVAPGTSATYTGAAPRIALGISLTRFLRSDAGTPGFSSVLNVRLTWGAMIARPRWHEPDGSEVSNGGLTPAYNGVALSIQLGGGGG